MGSGVATATSDVFISAGSSADDNFFGARFVLGDSLQNLLYLARRVPTEIACSVSKN